MIYYILFAFEVLCLFLHVVKRRQTIRPYIGNDIPLEEDKTGHSLPNG